MWFSLPAELATSAGMPGLDNIMVEMASLCNLHYRVLIEHPSLIV